MSMMALILACVAGRTTYAMQASHPALISTSGGRLAAFTRRLVLAMAHQRLGQADEARHWFDKAVKWIDNTGLEAPRDSADALRSLHPHDSLACMVLRREAETLLGLQPRPAR